MKAIGEYDGPYSDQPFANQQGRFGRELYDVTEDFCIAKAGVSDLVAAIRDTHRIADHVSHAYGQSVTVTGSRGFVVYQLADRDWSIVQSVYDVWDDERDDDSYPLINNHAELSCQLQCEVIWYSMCDADFSEEFRYWKHGNETMSLLKSDESPADPDDDSWQQPYRYRSEPQPEQVVTEVTKPVCDFLESQEIYIPYFSFDAQGLQLGDRFLMEIRELHPDNLMQLDFLSLM